MVLEEIIEVKRSKIFLLFMALVSALPFAADFTQDFRGTENQEHPHIGALVETRVT